MAILETPFDQVVAETELKQYREKGMKYATLLTNGAITTPADAKRYIRI